MAWDESRNNNFAADVYNFAAQLRQLTINAYLLLGKFTANDVGADAAFVDARGVAKADSLATVQVAADLVAFVRNATVTQFDREDVLNRILGGTLN